MKMDRRNPCLPAFGFWKRRCFAEFSPEDVIACYPDDLHKFLGPNTRVVAVSTHNPLGVTFAAGVYASVFGTSKHPINSHYTRQLFLNLKESPWRKNFKVIVGGSGAWQIAQTHSHEEFGVDCVVEGRSESAQTLELFHGGDRGKRSPAKRPGAASEGRESILLPPNALHSALWK